MKRLLTLLTVGILAISVFITPINAAETVTKDYTVTEANASEPFVAGKSDGLVWASGVWAQLKGEGTYLTLKLDIPTGATEFKITQCRIVSVCDVFVSTDGGNNYTSVSHNDTDSAAEITSIDLTSFISGGYTGNFIYLKIANSMVGEGANTFFPTFDGGVVVKTSCTHAETWDFPTVTDTSSFSVIQSNATESYIVNIDSAVQWVAGGAVAHLVGDGTSMTVKFAVPEGVLSYNLTLRLIGVSKVEASADNTTYSEVAYNNTDPSKELTSINLTELAKTASGELYLRIVNPRSGDGASYFPQLDGGVPFVVTYIVPEPVNPPDTDPVVPPDTDPVVPPDTDPVVPPDTDPVAPPTGDGLTVIAVSALAAGCIVSMSKIASKKKV